MTIRVAHHNVGIGRGSGLRGTALGLYPVLPLSAVRPALGNLSAYAELLARYPAVGLGSGLLIVGVLMELQAVRAEPGDDWPHGIHALDDSLCSQRAHALNSGEPINGRVLQIVNVRE